MNFCRSCVLLCASSLLLNGCDRDPTGVVDERNPSPPERGVHPLGLVEVSITGLGSSDMSASAAVPALPGVAANLSQPGNAGGSGDGSVQLEFVTNGTFVEGRRGVDGVRYVYATFRVRNAQSNGTPYDTPRQNLTFLAVSASSTIGATPVARLNRFDGSPADTALAKRVVPTGAVALGDSLKMRTLYPDVLQALSEAEAAAVSAPAGVTDVFPYGFVVRNPNRSDSRMLPASPGANQYDGLVTFAFRLPLAAASEQDPFAISILFLAVDDSETRVTESIEEQTVEGRAAVAARATSLGATSVTVLAGSPSTAYTGQRRLCTVRAAGSAGTPVSGVTDPGAYTRLAFFRPGEQLDPCAAGFRSGSADRPGVGLPFDVVIRAMDRYGNPVSAVADTVTVTSSAPGMTASPTESALNAGEATFTVTFSGYGTPRLTSVGRRHRGWMDIEVAGITRTWTGASSTVWSEGANWDVGVAPLYRDSVIIPVGVPNYPVLYTNTGIGGVDVADGATLTLGGFDLTASANVSSAPASGGILGSTGRLVLTGNAATVSGRVPRVRVTGTYSLAGNLTAQGPFTTELGKIRSTGYRLRVEN